MNSAAATELSPLRSKSSDSSNSRKKNNRKPRRSSTKKRRTRSKRKRQNKWKIRAFIEIKRGADKTGIIYMLECVYNRHRIFIELPSGQPTPQNIRGEITTPTDDEIAFQSMDDINNYINDHRLPQLTEYENSNEPPEWRFLSDGQDIHDYPGVIVDLNTQAATGQDVFEWNNIAPVVADIINDITAVEHHFRNAAAADESL